MIAKENAKQNKIKSDSPPERKQFDLRLMAYATIDHFSAIFSFSPQLEVIVFRSTTTFTASHYPIG
jgi:hypothetical protein